MLESRQQAGTLVLTCQFERLDAAKASAFREAFNQHSESVNGRVVLDFSKVRFVDSTGLGAVVACLKARSGRGELALAGLNGAVADLFRLTRLDGVFSIFETVDDALG